MVYVINYDGTPLMPCTQVVARLLLKQGKAKCIKKTPFTIKLLYQTTNYTQKLTLGVDTGSSKIGSAVVDSKNDVIYLSEVEVRNDISKKMKRRLKYRKNRRNRKARYRKPRWMNRKNSFKTNRFSPTMTSKINSHLKEIDFVKAILPVTKIILETSTFDTHALKNPDILRDTLLYQMGVNYGYANTKAYILARDEYTCRHCKGKSKDKRLHVHHVVFRENGGSDDEKNLMILCKTCHKKVHRGEIVIKGGKKKGQLKYATQINSIRVQLLKKIPEAKETFGFITKEHRQILGLEKEHYFDAAVIASQGKKIQFKVETVLVKKCVADGDYQRFKGICGEIKIPIGKIQGFRKFDKIKYNNDVYFIKGRYSTGYVILMDINGNKIDFKPIPKFNNIRRISARDSWIVFQKLSIKTNTCS